MILLFVPKNQSQRCLQQWYICWTHLMNSEWVKFEDENTNSDSCKAICWYQLIPANLDWHLYTGWPRRNVSDFGRVFLMLKYTDKTQNTYIQSWTVTEIMDREKCGLLAVPRTAPVQLTRHVYTAHVLETGMQSTLCLRYERLVVRSCKNAFCVFPRGILWHAFCVWILQRQCTSCLQIR